MNGHTAVQTVDRTRLIGHLIFLFRGTRMSDTYSFNLLYAFKHAAFFVVELQRLDLPDDAPKGDVYQWLHVDMSTAVVTPLGFRKMSANARVFDDTSLMFTADTACFTDAVGKTHDMTPIEGADVPATVRQLLSDFISKLK